MKKIKTILAFGDSHIAGCELSNKHTLTDYLSGKITIEQADEDGKRLAFPQLIANSLSIPCYNFAMSGGSNDRSLRLLVKAVQEFPSSLVIFGYTSTDRKEFYYPDNGKFLGRDKDNFIQVGIQWEGIKMNHPINDSYLKIMRPYNNLDQYVFIVDSICNLFAKRVFHLPLFPENKIKNLFDFEGSTNYLDWCTKKGFTKMPYYHYGQDAHDALAKLILEKL